MLRIRPFWLTKVTTKTLKASIIIISIITANRTVVEDLIWIRALLRVYLNKPISIQVWSPFWDPTFSRSPHQSQATTSSSLLTISKMIAMRLLKLKTHFKFWNRQTRQIFQIQILRHSSTGKQQTILPQHPSTKIEKVLQIRNSRLKLCQLQCRKVICQTPRQQKLKALKLMIIWSLLELLWGIKMLKNSCHLWDSVTPMKLCQMWVNFSRSKKGRDLSNMKPRWVDQVNAVVAHHRQTCLKIGKSLSLKRYRRTVRRQKYSRESLKFIIWI